MCKYKDTNLGIKKLDFGMKRGMMAVFLTDGRMVLVPVSMFPARNDGNADTEDVIELYLKDELSPFAPPNPVLCGFRRVALKAGEQAEFHVPINAGAFTVVTEEGERIPGSGQWRLYAGFGAPDRRTEELTGTKNQSVLITD